MDKKIEAAIEWIEDKRHFIENAKGDADYMKRLRDQLEVIDTIELALRSAPDEVVIGDAEFLFNTSRAMVKNAMSKHPNGVKIVTEIS